LSTQIPVLIPSKEKRKCNRKLPQVSTTSEANFATCSACVVDTGGKFATSVNDTDGKLPPVSTTPVANLPPVSTILAENLPPVSTTLMAKGHRCQ
jgi:hypothetical protein